MYSFVEEDTHFLWIHLINKDEPIITLIQQFNLRNIYLAKYYFISIITSIALCSHLLRRENALCLWGTRYSWIDKQLSSKLLLGTYREVSALLAMYTWNSTHTRIMRADITVPWFQPINEMTTINTCELSPTMLSDSYGCRIERNNEMTI